MTKEYDPWEPGSEMEPDPARLQTWIVERWNETQLMGVSTYPTEAEAQEAARTWEGTEAGHFARARRIEQKRRLKS